MEEVKIKIKILTPMFSYGTSRKAEFRISELKSLMRSTFRELYDFNESSNDLMKKVEGELFGSLNHKSPITFCMQKNKGNSYELLIPHHESDNKVSCISSETELNLCMFLNNDINSGVYIHLLILSSILGGLGKRVRKGCGAFTITKIEIVGNDKKTKEYKELLSRSPYEIFKEIYKDMDLENGTVKTALTNRNENYYETIFKGKGKYPYIQSLSIEKTKVNFTKALYSISNETHERLYNYLPKDKNYNTDVLGGREKRFASPIYITFWENLKADKFLIIKVLNHDYNGSLNYIDSKENRIVCKDNNEYIDKFINQIKEKVVVKS